MPMLPRKTFATLSLKYFFLWDVRFGGQIVRFTVEHLWIINEILGIIKFLIQPRFSGLGKNPLKIRWF